MSAGYNGYISGISSDKRIKAIQLWQFIGSKIFFRLSLLSNNQKVCKICGIHSEYPFTILCKKNESYDLSEFPITNLSVDGYTYNYKRLKGCHKDIFAI
jgi:hypothetical protein